MAAITLKEVKTGLTADLHKSIIDEFVAGDYLFNVLPMQQVANPITGGAGWLASYVRVKEEAKADFRDINGKYTETYTKKELKTAEVKIYGGKIVIDRALRDQGGVENEIAFQMAQLIKAVKKGLSYNLINGAVATDGKQFDGLDALVKSSSTDVDAKEFDLTTFDKIKNGALEFTSILDDFLSTLSGKPSALLMNKTMYNKLNVVAKTVGLNNIAPTEFGIQVNVYNGIPIIALEDYNGKDIIETSVDGKTSIYAVKFGEDGLFLATPSTGKTLDVEVPVFNGNEQAPGLVEFRAVPVLRFSKSCGVLRNIKVK